MFDPLNLLGVPRNDSIPEPQGHRPKSADELVPSVVSLLLVVWSRRHNGLAGHPSPYTPARQEHGRRRRQVSAAGKHILLGRVEHLRRFVQRVCQHA